MIKVGGHIIIFVPHKYLYEKRPDLPSLWNGDHRRFYTPASLLKEIEESLPPNGYRIRHLLDDDEGFRYDQDQASVPTGHYLIEIVIERIVAPSYANKLEYPHHLKQSIESFDRIVIGSIAQAVEDGKICAPLKFMFSRVNYFTPWHKLLAHFVHSEPAELRGRRLDEEQMREIVRPWLELVEVDTQSYVDHYRDLENFSDPAFHWRHHGYFEGRLGTGFEFATTR